MTGMKQELSPQQLQDIHVVILHKEEGAGLGFSIAGGCDRESKALTVSKRHSQQLCLLHNASSSIQSALAVTFGMLINM